MEAQGVRCPACGDALRPLGSVGFSAQGCDACTGFWLDNSATAILGAANAAATASAPRRCPWCDGEMRPTPAAGPTTVWLDRCEQHGYWFDAADPSAISDATLSARIAHKRSIRALAVR